MGNIFIKFTYFNKSEFQGHRSIQPGQAFAPQRLHSQAFLSDQSISLCLHKAYDCLLAILGLIGGCT